ncbi:MAG TPA: HAD family acid phosphatase [Candidatus Aquilonibacter sp.]|nr:HAD family acid phosphatase [Candidatus Aquilonibacter sp.]
MRCISRARASRANALRWVVVIALSAATLASAQQPGPVPTDHYGPPACSVGAKPPTHSDATDRARNERNQALDDSHILPSAEPLPNFGVDRYKLTEYGDCTGDSGCYWADLDAQYKRAEAELRNEIATRKQGDKLAIVMDIDETTLSNYCEMKREDFGYIWSIYRPYELSGTAVAIPGALRLFNEAREAGVAVFFITGRPGKQDPRQPPSNKDETAATARNLEAAGFHGWAGLRLRTGDENHMPTIPFKTRERRLIAADGYRILLSVGDQWSDLLGDPQADVSVKLPNPFYFIP